MRRKVLIGFVLLFISSLTFYRMLRPGFYPMHDDMQAMRLHQMHQCFIDGQIPCRWVPDMGFGYGYPQFNYYAPLPYYVMEFFHLLGFSILSSVKLGFILSVLIGVGGMYMLSSSLWGPYAGILSASFFALLPYRSVNMWVRGAMGELWGLAFFPFVFLAVRETIQRNKNSEVILAIFLSALMTSHNISIVIFLPFAIAWASYLLYQKHGITSLLFKFKNLKRLILGFIWGFLISAFFVIPAWTEKGLVQVDSLTGGYFDYRQHFVSFTQLFTQNYWNFGSSQSGVYDEVFLGVGILHWVIALTSLVVLLFLKRKKTIKTVFLLVLLALAASFMAHPKSALFWKSLSVLKFVQFPWRFLLVSGFLFSLAAGSIVASIKKKEGKAKSIVAPIVCLLIFLSASYFRPSSWIDIADQEKLSGSEWLRQQTISIYDYLPKTVKNVPDEPATLEPTIISGEGNFFDIEKGSNWYKVTVDVLSDGFTMQLPIYYFPNWIVEVNDKNSSLIFDNELGLISIDLERGINEVYAELKNTPIRKISNMISLFSVLLIPYYLTRQKRSSKER